MYIFDHMKLIFTELRMGDDYLEIPYDVLFQILLRLPVKSLVRLAGVCKAWHKMMSFDPDFIQAHFRITAKKPEFKHKITVPVWTIPGEVRSYCYGSCVCIDNIKVYPDFHDDTVVYTYFEVLASCNGMLLIGRVQKELYLWNPTTGSYKKLNSNSCHTVQDLRMYGLCFDSACSAFKVIRIVKTVSGFRDEGTTVGIYNSGTDSWKMVKEFPYTVFRDQPGLIFKGFPHWIVGSQDSRGVIIIYFEDKKFKEIDLPVLGLDDIALLKLYEADKINIAVLDGFLYLDIKYKSWVMKEYGGSWLKLKSEETFHKLGLNHQQQFIIASYFETPISPHIGTRHSDE